jgi:hypothetical protein
MPLVCRYPLEKGQAMIGGTHSQRRRSFFYFSNFATASMVLTVPMPARGIDTLGRFMGNARRVPEQPSDMECTRTCVDLRFLYCVLCTRGQRTLLIGWKLTPGVNLPPINIFAADRDGGGRVLFVLACGLASTRSESVCAICPGRMQHWLV